MPKSHPIPLKPSSFQKSLLSWYDRSKRDLPWRRTSDPYAIFVSEMMLQQTQVKTVIPYFHRFMKELPNWKSLAETGEEQVLKLWEGLGYYRRARNLQAAAKMVLSDFQGKLPDTLEAVQELPGVGPYSAGALLSIAYQKPFPLVDGNVNRVFARLFLLKGDLKAGDGKNTAWDIATRLVPTDRPGDFNQALMELGATVCLPDDPQCLLRPFLKSCLASQKGLQTQYPAPIKAKENVEIRMAAFFIEKKGKYLVRKRPEDERWLKGMWEFPSVEGTTFEDARETLEKKLNTLSLGSELRDVRHQITHHRIHLKLFKANPPEGLRATGSLKWVDAKGLAGLPFSSAQDKLRQWFLRTNRSEYPHLI